MTVANDNRLTCWGVGRDAENPKAVSVCFNRPLTDAELRFFHEVCELCQKPILPREERDTLSGLEHCPDVHARCYDAALGLTATPPCRVCGKTEQVGIYREDAPEQTICPECCPGATHHDEEQGHQFHHEPGEGQMCTYCGIARRDTDYDYYDDGEF